MPHMHHEIVMTIFVVYKATQVVTSLQIKNSMLSTGQYWGPETRCMPSGE